MTCTLPDFSKPQWQFLALYRAIGTPLSITVAGDIIPLLPGPFLDLFKKAVEFRWLVQKGKDSYQFSKQSPQSLKKKLDNLNTPVYLSSLAKRLLSAEDADDRKKDVAKLLLVKAGRSLDVAREEYLVAKDCIRNNRLDDAFESFQKTLALITNTGENTKSAKLFISVVIHYSYLSTLYGKATRKTFQLMNRALKLARKIGDIRSCAVIKMQLGLYMYLTQDLSKAISSLSSGLDIVRQLGDEDIRSQTTSYIGFYYFMTGRYRESTRYCLQAFQDGIEIKYNPYILSVMGYSLGFQGRFSTAIGCMDYIKRLAKHQADPQMAAYCQIVMGFLLVMMGKLSQGKEMMVDAMDHNQKKSPNLAEIQFEFGMGYAEYLCGRLDEAYRHFKNTFQLANCLNINFRNFIVPWMLEANHAFIKAGLDLKEFYGEIENDLDFYIREPHIGRKGVALRIRAQISMDNGGNIEEIEKDLLESEQFLDQSGDILELAKTRLCLTKIKTRQGRKKQGAWYAGQAEQVLRRYDHLRLKEDWYPILEFSGGQNIPRNTAEDMFQRLLDLVENLSIMDVQLTPKNFLFRFFITTSYFLWAERGAYFHYTRDDNDADKDNHRFKLMGQFNLDEETISHTSFAPSMEAVHKAFVCGHPITVKLNQSKSYNDSGLINSFLCLPIKDGLHTHGVLYYDNVYLEGQYMDMPMASLKRIALFFDNIINQVFQIYRSLETETDTMYHQNSMNKVENSDFITVSPVMKKQVQQMDRIAQSDAPVLITGETGVGKGLLAKRLHEKSKRDDGPFIVVDLNTIPESLVESELFGYEKGAFTGADRKKIGHLEMAHRGTLFLDEIGEIPAALQSKLLQFVQEKAFTRIGGTQLIRCDFRLITATNRDLKSDVQKGAFRQDLFYRLNVIPFNVPSLKERRKDILFLARHFLSHYAAKHHKPSVRLNTRYEQMLLSYHWPGNVRELKNIMERCILLSPETPLDLILPSHRTLSDDHPFSDTPSLDEMQRRYIDYILTMTNGKIAGEKGAAKILGMKRSTLYTRMHRLGLMGES